MPNKDTMMGKRKSFRYWPLPALMLVLVCLFALARGQGAPVTFAAHPRLQYTTEELAAWKADPARQGELTALLARADRIVQNGLTVPKESGQWIFYYACPKDGARLRAESPERHVCPTCGAVYTDARTVAAYRCVLHNQLDSDIDTLGLAYALSGDVKYAVPARAALLELARLYPTWERHDRWGRTGLLAVVGGRRYAQLLDESTSLITLAQGYDLLANAPCISAADRQIIEEQLIREVARDILAHQFFIEAQNNHRTWFNAAYANAGVAIGDAALVRESVDGASGLRWQLEHSVGADGLWYEGTMAYQFYALSAIESTVDAVRRVGIDFRDNARLKSLWLGPLNLAYPNGQLPVMHDSDPGSLADRRDYYRWAYDYFHEPRFAALAGVKVDGAPAQAVLHSDNLAGMGVAVLRRGSGPQASCALIDYGQHGGHHGHPDKLNLLLFALGNELLPDIGRISYSVPEYETWARTTVAHNTLTLGEHNQQPDTGRLIYFSDAADYAAALTASDGAYPGYALRRFTVLTDTLLIDVLAVRGAQSTHCDSVLHAIGIPSTALPLTERIEPLGKDGGYQHLSQLRTGAGAARMDFTFTLPNKSAYRLCCLGDESTSVFTGQGIGYHLTERVPFVLRRREASATAFITVIDLSGDGRALTELTRVPLTSAGQPVAETDGVALHITSGKETFRVALDLRDTPAHPFMLDGKPVERCLLRHEPLP